MAEPIRMCRVCRTKAPKAELQRWVVQEGKLVADKAQRLPGRGVYICDKERCREILPKALRLKSS